MFINELRLYVEYLKNEIGNRFGTLSKNDHKYLTTFRANLQEGIEYYRALIPRMAKETERYRDVIRLQLQELEAELMSQVIPSPGV